MDKATCKEGCRRGTNHSSECNLCHSFHQDHDDGGAPDDDEDGHGGGEGDGDSREQEEERGDEQRNLSAKPQFGRSEKEEWAIGLGL